MSPAYVDGRLPVNAQKTVVGAPRHEPAEGEQFSVITYDAFNNKTLYRAVRWFDSRGLEWIDEPSDLARETIQSHLE
jgi:hypothetical protein